MTVLTGFAGPGDQWWLDSTDLVRNPDNDLIWAEILGVSGDKQSVRTLGGSKNDGIGQFHFSIFSDCDCLNADCFVHVDDFKSVSQPIVGLALCHFIRADHDFHPGNDADRLVIKPGQLFFRRGNALQVVDQYAGIEQCLHQSPRSFSWYSKPSENPDSFFHSPKASTVSGDFFAM